MIEAEPGVTFDEGTLADGIGIEPACASGPAAARPVTLWCGKGMIPYPSGLLDNALGALSPIPV